MIHSQQPHQDGKVSFNNQVKTSGWKQMVLRWWELVTHRSLQQHQTTGNSFSLSLLVTKSFPFGHLRLLKIKRFQFCLLLLQNSSVTTSLVELLYTKVEFGLHVYLSLERYSGHNIVYWLFLSNSTQSFWKIQQNKCLEECQESSKAKVNMKTWIPILHSSTW